jgi:hypothetical protein
MAATSSVDTDSGSGFSGEASTATTSTGVLASQPAFTVSPNGTTSAGGTDLGQAAVTDAQSYLGVPYVYGGTDPTKGLDCSALVQRSYADLGVTLPRTSQEQSTMGSPVASLADAKPGDLVCFGVPATHIGIYVGNGKMIDAPHTGTSVQIQTITKVPSTIRRIAGTALAGTATSVVSASSAALVARPTALGGLGAGVYAARFSAAEAKYNLPAGLLSAVAKTESGYNPGAVSSAGAIGLMQLMPATASALGVDPTDPSQAIDGAARLLQGQLHKYGSVPLALAAYNAGGPAVDKYGGIPPYQETQNYVKKVMTTMGENV